LTLKLLQPLMTLKDTAQFYLSMLNVDVENPITMFGCTRHLITYAIREDHQGEETYDPTAHSLYQCRHSLAVVWTALLNEQFENIIETCRTTVQFCDFVVEAACASGEGSDSEMNPVIDAYKKLRLLVESVDQGLPFGQAVHTHLTTYNKRSALGSTQDGPFPICMELCSSGTPASIATSVLHQTTNVLHQQVPFL
jgi:hypothetical protein